MAEVTGIHGYNRIGHYGDVWIGIWSQTTVVAMKSLNKKEKVKELLDEAAMLK